MKGLNRSRKNFKSLIGLCLALILLSSCQKEKMNNIVDPNEPTLWIISALLDNKPTIFLSSSTHDGALGGLSGADAKCGSNAQAVLVFLGQREPGINWVLRPDTTYYTTSQGDLLETDSNGRIKFNLKQVLGSSGQQMWTGAIDSAFSPAANAGGQCSDWSGTASVSGGIGNADSITNTFVYSNSPFCATQFYLLCVMN